MAATYLPASRPVRAVIQELSPGGQLLDALTRLADLSGTEPAAVVLQFSDGEVIRDVGLTGPQATALAGAVDRLTRPRQPRR